MRTPDSSGTFGRAARTFAVVLPWTRCWGSPEQEKCIVAEKEWAACDGPQKLLDFVRPRTSRRKLQLFLCAQLRRSCPPISGFRRRLAELLERVADGVLS